jgi:hypothetical protein
MRNQCGTETYGRYKATLAFFSASATTRSQESKWGKLATQALIGDKKSSSRYQRELFT